MKVVKLLLYLLLLSLPLGQFSKLPLPFVQLANVNIYLSDILIPMLIFVWLSYHLTVEKSLKLPPLSGRIALFGALSGLSLINGFRWIETSEFVISMMYWVRWLEYACLYPIVYSLVEEDKTGKESLTIIKILIGGTLVFALLGLAQFVLFPDFSKYVEHGWDPHYFRVLSTFFDPNFAGVFLVLGLNLIVSMITCGPVKEKTRLLFTIYCLPITAAIILTFSRSTYATLLVGVGILGLVKSRKLLAIFLVLCVLAFIFIPRVRTRVVGAIQLDVTAQARLEDWQKTFKIVKDNWISGVGFNAFRYAQSRYGYFKTERGFDLSGGHAGAGADSSLLFAWATTGVFGLLVLLSIYVGFLWRSWRGFQEGSKLKQALSLATVSSILSLLVHAQFVNSLFFPWIMVWMWVLMGLTLSI